MSSDNNIVVIGASGHAKVVMDVIEKEGKYRIAGLIDSHEPVSESVLGASPESGGIFTVPPCGDGHHCKSCSRSFYIYSRVGAKLGLSIRIFCLLQSNSLLKNYATWI